MRTILVFVLAVQFVSANDLYNLDDRFLSNYYFFQDSIENEIINQNQTDDTLIVYPAKPMLYSLIFFVKCRQIFNKTNFFMRNTKFTPFQK